MTLERVEHAVDDIESTVRARGEPEISSKEIGRLATDALRDLDQLAYIRFCIGLPFATRTSTPSSGRWIGS